MKKYLFIFEMRKKVTLVRKVGWCWVKRSGFHPIKHTHSSNPNLHPKNTKGEAESLLFSHIHTLNHTFKISSLSCFEFFNFNYNSPPSVTPRFCSSLSANHLSFKTEKIILIWVCFCLIFSTIF